METDKTVAVEVKGKKSAGVVGAGKDSRTVVGSGGDVVPFDVGTVELGSGTEVLTDDEREYVRKLAESDAHKPEIILRKEQFRTQDGREMYAYKVRGQMMGRDVVMEFTPSDLGGYQNLDFIYVADTDGVVMNISYTVYKNAAKKLEKQTIYTVSRIGEYGELMQVTLKPKQTSDKERFAMWYNQEVARLKHTAGK